MSRKNKSPKDRKRPSLSLCTIVRDEEDSLAHCLAGVDGLVDEIVLVDTGSRDRTIDVARSFGARVVSHPWEDDFAAARNKGLGIAEGQWILVLDADEEIPKEDHRTLRRALKSTGYLGFFLRFVVGGDAIPVLRVFRNLPDLRYKGPIHEQVANIDAQRIGNLDVRVLEHRIGRRSRNQEKRSDRNIRILEKALAKEPDDPYLLFTLGQEYFRQNRFQDAFPLYRKAYNSANNNRIWVPRLVCNLALCFHRLGQSDVALALLDHHLDSFPGFTDLRYWKGTIYLSQGQFDLAEKELLTCLEMGEAPYLYPSRQGAGGTLALSQLAETYFRWGRREQTILVLKHLLEVEPGNAQAAVRLALLLVNSEGADRAKSELKSIIEHQSPQVQQTLSKLFLHSAKAATARLSESDAPDLSAGTETGVSEQ